jgi:ABC-type phosphate transport system permease subunit
MRCCGYQPPQENTPTPHHIYLLAIEVPGGQDRAYASAVILVMLLLLINGLALVLMRRLQRRLTTA